MNRLSRFAERTMGVVLVWLALFTFFPDQAAAQCVNTTNANLPFGTNGTDVFECTGIDPDGVAALGGADTINVRAGADVQAVIAGDAGDDTVNVFGGTIGFTTQANAVDLSVAMGNGDDNFFMSGGTIQGRVEGNDGIFNFTMTGGTIQEFATGGGLADTFDVSGGSVVRIFGFDGNNTATIRGTGTVTELISMGSGDDTITIADNAFVGDAILPGLGSDTIFISGGEIVGRVDPGGSGRIAVAGDAGIETYNVSGGVIGGDLTGNTGADVYNISGGDINGWLLGGDDNDEFNVSGGTIDSIQGGRGTDSIEVFNGANIMGSIFGDDNDGDQSNDSGDFILVRQGASVTIIDGQGGADTITVTNATVAGDGVTGTTVNGGDGDDVININGTASITGSVGGNNGSDRLNLNGGTISQSAGGGDGSDIVTLNGTVIGSDLRGGTGTDLISILSGSVGTNVHAGNNTNTSNDADTVNMSGGTVIGGILGDLGVDTIAVSGGTVGMAASLSISAGGGNDIITISGTAQINGIIAGDVGDDTINLLGGTVNENVRGNVGSDAITLNGATLARDILGNSGSDTLLIQSGTARNVLTGGDFLGNLSSDPDMFTMTGGTLTGGVFGDDGIDDINISGGSIAGNVQANAGADDISFGGTASLSGSLRGDEGNDVIGISSGNIALNVEGNAGSDTIQITGGVISNNLYTGETALTSIDTDTLTFNGGAVLGSVFGDAGVDNVTLISGTIGNGVANAGSTEDNIQLGGGNDNLVIGANFAFSNISQIGTTRGRGGAGVDSFEINSAFDRTILDSHWVGFETITYNGNGHTLFLRDTDSNRATLTLDASGGTFTANSGEVNLTLANSSLRAGTLTFNGASTLSGIGEVVGNTTIFGLHDPGNSVGTMTMTGNLTVASGSTTRIEFDESGDAGTNITAANRGTEFDAIDVNGNLVVQSGAKFVIDVLDGTPETALADLIAQVEGGTPALFPIYEVTGTLTVASFGSLNLIPTSGSNIAGTAWEFYTSFGPTNVFGVQLVLDVPEPATLGLTFAGLLGGFAIRRRLRQRTGECDRAAA